MRLIKDVGYNTRAINFTGRIVFAQDGEHVAPFINSLLSEVPREQLFLATVSEEEHERSLKATADAHELGCVEQVLDAMSVPAEMAPGVPFTVHGRVQEGLQLSKEAREIQRAHESILTETERQKIRGYTAEHDDTHVNGEIRAAAEAYLVHADAVLSEGAAPKRGIDIGWPWDEVSFQPDEDPIRNLVKAGALIAAEIARLQRAKRA